MKKVDVLLRKTANFERLVLEVFGQDTNMTVTNKLSTELKRALEQVMINEFADWSKQSQDVTSFISRIVAQNPELAQQLKQYSRINVVSRLFLNINLGLLTQGFEKALYFYLKPGKITAYTIQNQATELPQEILNKIMPYIKSAKAPVSLSNSIIEVINSTDLRDRLLAELRQGSTLKSGEMEPIGGDSVIDTISFPVNIK